MEGLEVSAVKARTRESQTTQISLMWEDDINSELDGTIDVDLEEFYLEKLKVQRERIEKLEKCYTQKEQQLGKEAQRANEMVSEVERLTAFVPFKSKYEQLKEGYADLITKCNAKQSELQSTKQELGKIVDESSSVINKLKTELKAERETALFTGKHHEEVLREKEGTVKKLTEEWKNREAELQEENKSLKNAVWKQKQQLQKQCAAFDKQKDRVLIQIKERDASIQELERAFENAKKSNYEIKNDFAKYKQQAEGCQQQLSATCAKLKQQLSQNKKTVNDKENKVKQLEAELKKTNGVLQQLKTQNSDMKDNFKKTCQAFECNNQKLKFDAESEIAHLEILVKELKDSLGELMEVKNQLIQENRKLTMVIKKKEQAEKQRKQLLKSEFQEIDRIEKVIDRLQ